MEWSCVYCGYVQKNRLNPQAMRIQCKNRECKGEFELTLVFRPPCRGKGRAPDTIMELAPMPLALMGLRRFNARTPAHEYRDVNQVVNTSAGAASYISDTEHERQADRRDP